MCEMGGKTFAVLVAVDRCCVEVCLSVIAAGRLFFLNRIVCFANPMKLKKKLQTDNKTNTAVKKREIHNCNSHTHTHTHTHKELERDGWVSDGEQKVKQITRPC